MLLDTLKSVFIALNNIQEMYYIESTVLSTDIKNYIYMRW